jgi:phosphohistidine swiveling domain-containing protein
MDNIFYREVVRDYSLIIEEAWFFGLTASCDKLFGKNPFSPINIFNLHEGAIELWHEVNAYNWLLDSLVDKTKKDPKFIKKIIADYQTSLTFHKKVWKKGFCETREELESYIDAVFDSMIGFIVFYYLGVDERTPKEMRDFVLKLREEDKFFEEGDRVIRKSINKIYPQTVGLESGVIFSEIKNNKIPSVIELKERSKNCVLIPGEFFKNVSLKELVEIYPTFEFPLEVVKEKKVTELKGSVAFIGRVSGFARIVKRKDQLDKVKEGDILISPMTLPEFLPAMKRAGAFVTDEGGITAHAAIIARELKKPCIIGTKFATQVFNDGDFLEVDAKKGVVKLIKKVK